MKLILLLSKPKWVGYITSMLLFLFFTGICAITQAQTASVTTDKLDYYPGDYVTITGEGFQAGEKVKLLIEHTYYYHDDEVLYATVDNDGNFSNSEYLITDDELGEIFLLTATGLTSGIVVETWFTDSPMIHAVSLSPTSNTACIPSSGTVQVSYTVTSVRGRAGTVNGIFTISALPNGVTSNALESFTANGNNPFPDRLLTLTITSSAEPGNYTISVTLADGNDQATGTGTLILNKVPTITCPNSISEDNDEGTCGASVVLSATANGAPEPVINYDIGGTAITSPHTFPVGTTTVTATATNECGVAKCDFTVTVTDDQDPTITAPSAVSVSSDAGLCTASGVVLGTPVTADNCSVASVVNDAPEVFPLGETTVTWTVTDGSGNTATATQIVTVTDDQDPTITAPSAVSVSSDAGLLFGSQCSQ